ncbi:MAG: hypothetical protein EOM20_10145 [Spartobacteria bacterium]|nr:hypothetical protein [Spartobacteria bacterium]
MKEKAEYVRVVNDGSRFWFSKGDEEFLALGVNCLLPTDHEDQSGRPFYNALALHDGDMESWAAEVTNRLHAWHFNTVAAWSHEYLYTNKPIYHTRVVWFGHWGSDTDMRLMDVFSDEYAANIEETAQKFVAPHARNEYLIGYFINNELPWYGLRGWPTAPHISLFSRYMRLPPLAPGKVELVTFMKTEYQDDFASLAEDWQVRADSFEELADIRRIRPASPRAKQLIFEWTGVVAHRYYQLCVGAIRRYDPNHLILGSRMAGTAPVPVLKACGEFCDVVSMNHYRKTGDFGTEQLGAVAALTGKPVMITEFSWRAMENNSGCLNRKGADVTVATQADRAECFRRYAREALEQPFIIGYDWFQYFDQPPHGRFDGEDSNYGLVDIHNEVYAGLTEAITEINRQAEDIHATSTLPFPEFDPDVLVDYRAITVRDTDTPLLTPVRWADGQSAIYEYSDKENGALIEIKAPGEQRSITVHTGHGWGCGLTLPAPRGQHPDGSMSLKGAKEIVVRLHASRDFLFNPGLNESGHGPVDAQTFDGFGQADGESFTHMTMTGEAGLHDYVISLFDLEENPHHGNQRGNKTVDTEAIAEIILYFPANQGTLDLKLDSVTIK